MEEMQIESKKEINITNKDKLTYSQKLLLNLLQNYSYEEIMNYIFDEQNRIVNDNLQLKLKELAAKIEIEELAKLLTKDEINKLYCIQKQEKYNFQTNSNKNEFLNLESHSICEISDSSLKKNEGFKKNNVCKNNKIKKEKKIENPSPHFNKIIYRIDSNDNNIYFYRFISIKKGDIFLLRCQDKCCRSKAFYNFETKEICIYEEHSIDIQNHIYLSDKSNDYIKGLIFYMKNNKEILSLEIFSDNSKHIINNMKINHSLKKEKQKDNIINSDTSVMLNKKRNNSQKLFNSSKAQENNNHPINKFNITKKYKNKEKKVLMFQINNKIEKNRDNNMPKINNKDINFNYSNLNSNEKINLNEDEKEEFINSKENYCEIKDKYFNHKKLLTKYEQICFGENRRLGTHFHKENDGKIFNYFGNNKEIKDFKMNYRCILKGCKSKASYDMKSRSFTILREHTKPYEEHYCSNPKDKRTKDWIDYLKANNSLSDLQIILI